MLLNEDIFDDVIDITIPDIEPIEITQDEIQPQPPEVGVDMGTSELIINCINKTWDSISLFNSVIATIPENTEVVEVVTNILGELNTQIGKLEAILKSVAPNAENIETGNTEAENEVDDYSSICSTSPFVDCITQSDEPFDPVAYDEDVCKAKRIAKFRNLLNLADDDVVTEEMIDNNKNDFNRVVLKYNVFPEKLRCELLGQTWEGFTK